MSELKIVVDRRASEAISSSLRTLGAGGYVTRSTYWSRAPSLPMTRGTSHYKHKSVLNSSVATARVLLVSNIRLTEVGDRCELRATITGSTLENPFALFYRFPSIFKSSVSLTKGDAFLAASLLPAMRTGESLQIAAPVSPRLLHSIDVIQDIYRSWDPSLSTVAITAETKDSAQRDLGDQVGCFFSLGVDSYYTLLKNVAKHHTDSQMILFLIFVRGFDIPLANELLSEKVLGTINVVVQELGKKTLTIETNLREFSDRYAEWGHLYHGAALASVALMFGALFKTVYIAATHTYAQMFPWGSHPILDPMWSTETLSIVHDGCEMRRVDKIRFIAQFSIALRTLRVCWLNPDSEYNCGRCEKCMRTMIGLHVAGALAKCETLPHLVDPTAVRSMRVEGANERSFVEELIASLSSSNTDLPIKSALEEVLHQSNSTPESLRLETLFFKVLQRIYFRAFGRRMCRELAR